MRCGQKNPFRKCADNSCSTTKKSSLESMSLSPCVTTVRWEYSAIISAMYLCAVLLFCNKVFIPSLIDFT